MAGPEDGSAFSARLRSWPIPLLEQAYGRRDAVLYALNVGVGELEDAAALDFVREDGEAVLPTFPTVLVPNSPWLFDPENGIDCRALMMRELTIELHRPIPREGAITFQERIGPILDRGEGKGAVLHLVGELRDRASGAHVATIERVTMAMRNGGFGGIPAPRVPAPSFPDRAPDRVDRHGTRKDSTLFFCLHGDNHPVHSDPAFATAMGYPGLVLHGMCTLGIIAQKLLVGYADYQAARFRSISITFKAPVFPGETLAIQSWKEDGQLLFQATAEGRSIVVAQGIAEITTAEIAAGAGTQSLR
ncbi:MaoC/PaaZ C-terminal domain-containing protein [Sphingomonas sp.]|uniref:MaoC/PaaZ C-terminal domain-containing protein n=1 Tax=Sphingomonas sp. TaxID=28214 RepID=UPI003AFF6569